MDAHAPIELKKIHRQLVREGNFKSARILLKFMSRGEVFISDGNDEAWETGVADLLLINYECSNKKSGFTTRMEN